jgi:hypothetical protein
MKSWPALLAIVRGLLGQDTSTDRLILENAAPPRGDRRAEEGVKLGWNDLAEGSARSEGGSVRTPCLGEKGR